MYRDTFPAMLILPLRGGMSFSPPLLRVSGSRGRDLTVRPASAYNRQDISVVMDDNIGNPQLQTDSKFHVFCFFGVKEARIFLGSSDECIFKTGYFRNLELRCADEEDLVSGNGFPNPGDAE